MSKYPQYMISENPMIEDTRVFILQTRPIMLLAEVHHFDNEADWMEAKRNVEVGASVDYAHDELILLQAVYIDAGKLEGEAQAVANRVAKMLRKMGDWYYAYLKWEDEQDHEFDN